MRTFFVTLVYELDTATDPDTRKLLRAELVGRRWQDRSEGKLLPSNALWMRRSAGDDETTTDLHRACGEDLTTAARAVRGMGRTVQVRRAWVQVAGAGTMGLVAVDLDANAQ